MHRPAMSPLMLKSRYIAFAIWPAIVGGAIFIGLRILGYHAAAVAAAADPDVDTRDYTGNVMVAVAPILGVLAAVLTLTIIVVRRNPPVISEISHNRRAKSFIAAAFGVCMAIFTFLIGLLWSITVNAYFDDSLIGAWWGVCIDFFSPLVGVFSAAAVWFVFLLHARSTQNRNLIDNVSMAMVCLQVFCYWINPHGPNAFNEPVFRNVPRTTGFELSLINSASLFSGLSAVVILVTSKGSWQTWLSVLTAVLNLSWSLSACNV